MGRIGLDPLLFMSAAIVGLLISPWAGAADTPQARSRFKEGRHYVVLETPARLPGSRVEVVEVFWYGCSHCYALDTVVEAWRVKGKPAYVDFKRVPGTVNELARTHARLFYTVKALRRLDDLHTALFREINEGVRLGTFKQFSEFVGRYGVGADAFQQAYRSEAVTKEVERAVALNRSYLIDKVPTLIVNGKYKTDLVLAEDGRQLLAIVNELAAREHGR